MPLDPPRFHRSADCYALSVAGDEYRDQVVARAVAGDRAAQASIDVAVDAAVTAGDYGEVDRWLRPIAAAAGTEPEALELLLGLVDGNGIVRRTASRHIADDHLLDEACQDALVSIARHIGSFEGRSRVTTWIHPIATNAARMATRDRRPAARRRHRPPSCPTSTPGSAG